MKIKEEYKNIDIEKIILEKSIKTFENNISQEWMDNFKNTMKKVRKNDWYDIFIVLYELVLKVNEDKQQLQIKGKTNGILDNIYITYQLLITDNQNIKLKISNDLDIDINTIILNVSKEYERNLTEHLSSICEDWKNAIIVKKNI